MPDEAYLAQLLKAIKAADTSVIPAQQLDHRLVRMLMPPEPVVPDQKPLSAVPVTPPQKPLSEIPLAQPAGIHGGGKMERKRLHEMPRIEGSVFVKAREADLAAARKMPGASFAQKPDAAARQAYIDQERQAKEGDREFLELRDHSEKPRKAPAAVAARSAIIPQPKFYLDGKPIYDKAQLDEAAPVARPAIIPRSVFRR